MANAGVCKNVGNIESNINGRITRYDPPKEVTVCGDIEMILEFESETERNFAIFRAINSNDTPTYYIIAEDDKFPMLVTGKEVEEFVSNISAAKAFVFNTWMNRWR